MDIHFAAYYLEYSPITGKASKLKSIKFKFHYLGNISKEYVEQDKAPFLEDARDAVERFLHLKLWTFYEVKRVAIIHYSKK